MKKLSTLLICAIFALASCSSDDSVQGPPGPPGPPGEGGFIGTALDLEGDFTAANDYTLSLRFIDRDIEVFESDAVLVYVKTGNGNMDANGVPIEIFRALPQTYFTGDKTIQYNFDFTFEDVFVFLDGVNANGTLLDFAALDSDYRLNQKFRIIVLPAAFAESRQQLDFSDVNAVMKKLNIKESDVIKN